MKDIFVRFCKNLTKNAFLASSRQTTIALHISVERLNKLNLSKLYLLLYLSKANLL